MNTIINAGDWIPTDGHGEVPHFATVFGRGQNSYYQQAADLALLGEYPVYVLRVKRLAEIDGVTEAVSDTSVQDYLSTVQMSGYVPITYLERYYLIYHREASHGYRWANSSLQSKWNASEASAEIDCIVRKFNESSSEPNEFYFDKGGGSAASIGTNIGYSLEQDLPIKSYRYYDDTAQTIEWFLEVGGNSYLNTCDYIWNFQQDYFWNGRFYGYSDDSRYKSNMETEVGPFALISGRYLMTKGNFRQFGSRIVSDLNAKLLVNGYSSPLWNHYTLNHLPDYDERRLENAVIAWGALHAYYPQMTSTMQTTLQGMCDIGWRGLIAEPRSFDSTTNRFRMWAGSQSTMSATGAGLMYMFLNGIVPKTGSIAIPLNDECYEDTASWSPATMFRFDYNNHQIRIPVNAGQLEFLFGSGRASYTFPSSGVYTVTFSDDWNIVMSTNRIGSFDSQFKYVPAGSNS
jgi:hypothetical protein